MRRKRKYWLRPILSRSPLSCVSQIVPRFSLFSHAKRVRIPDHGLLSWGREWKQIKIITWVFFSRDRVPMDKVSHGKNFKFYERAKNRPLSGIGSCEFGYQLVGQKRWPFLICMIQDTVQLVVLRGFFSIFTEDSSDLGTISTSKYFMNVQNV